MLKLKKFQEKKLTTKNIMISFAIMMVFMLTIIISKSYAIYKMQKEFDVIKSKVGSFSSGDVKVAVLVDGKETNEFPSYETNYKIESVECTNGVTGSFDVENWQVTIADMKATSTKCTVSFNSKETNEITPINMSKKEILALNEEYQNVAYEKLKTSLLNDTYPVGSIYMSTTDDTIEKVQDKFGGTWVKYAEDMTLVGASSSKAVNTTGGSSTVSLTTANLPSHSHSFTPAGNITSTFSGKRIATENAGSHNHSFKISGYTGWPSESIKGMSLVWSSENFKNIDSGTSTQHVADAGINMNSSGNHSHYFTASGSVSSTFTGSVGTTGSTGSGTAFNIQNPYISVYMYKRTA